MPDKIYVLNELITNKNISIEIEDNCGNTIGGINLKTGEYFGYLSIADVDGDYLFDTDNQLVRVQLD